MKNIYKFLVIAKTPNLISVIFTVLIVLLLKSCLIFRYLFLNNRHPSRLIYAQSPIPLRKQNAASKTAPTSQPDDLSSVRFSTCTGINFELRKEKSRVVPRRFQTGQFMKLQYRSSWIFPSFPTSLWKHVSFGSLCQFLRCLRSITKLE